MEALWAQWSYMGDGGSDASYVSFLVFRLSQRNFDMLVWYMIYGGLICALWWFGIWFMVVWYVLYDGLVYVIWCFDICLNMVFWYMLWYMIWYIFLVMLIYVHLYMDVNTANNYVIKLHYAVWMLCHYDYIVMLLCYHVVMLSWCYDVMWISTQ